MTLKSILIFIVLGGLLMLIWLSRRMTSRRFNGLPRVGIDPGFLGLRTQAAKDEFFVKGQQLLEQGYTKVRSVQLLANLLMDGSLTG